MERLIIVAFIVLIFVMLYTYRDTIQKYLRSPKIYKRRNSDKKNTNTSPKIAENFTDNNINTNKKVSSPAHEYNNESLNELDTEVSTLSSSNEMNEISTDTITCSSSVVFSHSEIESPFDEN